MGDFTAYLAVLVIVKIIAVRIKNTVAAEPKRLMNLKIETN